MQQDGRSLCAVLAAVFAIEQLLPTDRVSITIFDDKVETLAANALAVDKGPLVALLRTIEPRGSTALHGGWQEGGNQVRRHLVAGGLNRILLLSDGIANVGLSEPDALATDAHKLTAKGVSTTTLGLGDDYNEDLLEAMAQSGDGNYYYYVEHPTQLPTLFATELRGLMAAVGNGVTLQIKPCDGVSVVDILNDFDRLPGWLVEAAELLVAGMSVDGGRPPERLARTAARPAGSDSNGRPRSRPIGWPWRRRWSCRSSPRRPGRPWHRTSRSRNAPCCC